MGLFERSRARRVETKHVVIRYERRSWPKPPSPKPIFQTIAKAIVGVFTAPVRAIDWLRTLAQKTKQATKKETVGSYVVIRYEKRKLPTIAELGSSLKAWLKPFGRFSARRWIFLVSTALVLSGATVLLNVFWEPLVSDPITSAQQSDRANHFDFARSSAPPIDDLANPFAAAKEGTVFARVRVPRFGDGWVRLVGQGIRWHPTLNVIGIGHYRQSQLPGEVGNFAIAAHRGGFGGTFRDIDKLQKGDQVTVETRDSFFVYQYLQTKIVKPNDINVISAVPKELIGAHQNGHYMTMTSCYPTWVNTHRIVVWLALVEVKKKVS